MSDGVRIAANLVGVMLVFVTASCATTDSVAPPAQVPARSSQERPLDLSLVQLIARPEEFHGQCIRVHGFFRHEFEGTALYLHREDYEQGLSRNGFWMGGDPALSMKYVLVEGRFNAKRHGHMGLWSGAIEDVSRMESWPPGPPRAAN